MSDKIRDYWDARATASHGTSNATTDDVWLREAEIAAILSALAKYNIGGGTLLDVGCGDGRSTLRIVEAMASLHVCGLDFSPEMIELARANLTSRSALASRLSFDVGDVTNLDVVLGRRTFDIVLTDRCLINLETTAQQRQAIGQIARRVEAGGHYIAIENFTEGQTNMNAARRAVGLPEIPVRWHNLFFTEERFRSAATEYFEIVEWLDFASSYYFATRVIYSKMCQMRGETPDYNHEIHRLAVALPWTGRFSPIRMVVLRRATR